MPAIPTPPDPHSSGPADTGALAGPAPGRRRLPIADAVRASCGNTLEMYDFMVFGYYAAAIGRAFFPASGGAATSLLLSFATFGAGFLMRPLGAVVLGSYVDRIGVRRGLMLTLSLMAVGTLVLALMPGYATLGLVSPVLVLAARLLQGFSAGVELGSTSVYLGAIAPPGRKGLFVSFQSASQQLAVMAAAALGGLVSALLTPAQMAAWGWRVPLLAGCAIVPLLFVLRRSLGEADAAPARHATAGAVLRDLLRHRGIAARGAALVCMTTVSFYLITAYTPSFGRAELHLSAGTSLLVTFCVGLSNLVWLPVSGALSDRVGRRPIMLATALLMALTAFPLMEWLAAAPSFGRLLAALLWLSALYGFYNGAMIVFLTEYVPREVRTSGFSVAYSLATCVGGFTPAICTLLIRRTGDVAMPGAWLTAAALVSLAGILAARGPHPAATANPAAP
ncbi:tricarballylate/proton symporter TcuC [Rhizosaccharibacter radicis]|uniref:Tricarballylate/proton symporter TcuC n=1 Tax=Rhizosaccharibacter radicis TaxID=2782605 RepID=A0ABT1VSJ2_9PROT|nr:tricarballylate/proton symporter TcuC [Acetobacteraceae bacterium KSS12]